MRVVQQILAPRVQHTQKADRSAEMPRVSGDREQRGRTGAEQQIVDDLLVVEGQPGEFVREREDHMRVADRQEFGAPVGEPPLARVRQTLWAVPIPTRVERDGATAASVTAIEMTA